MSKIHWNDLPEGQLAAVQSVINADQAADASAANTLHDNGNSGAAKSISFANGLHQKVTLTASAPAITLTGLTAGQYAEMVLLVVQDATGSRLLPTFSPALDYGTAGAPTLSTAANKVDVFKLVSYDGVTVQAATVTKGF